MYKYLHQPNINELIRNNCSSRKLTRK